MTSVDRKPNSAPDSKSAHSKLVSRIKELPYFIVPKQISMRDAAMLGMFDAVTIYSTYRFIDSFINGTTKIFSNDGSGMIDYLQGTGMLIAASFTGSAGIIGRMTIQSSPSK